MAKPPEKTHEKKKPFFKFEKRHYVQPKKPREVTTKDNADSTVTGCGTGEYG